VINLGKQSLSSRIGIGVGDRLRLGHEEENGVADKRGQVVSDTEKGGARLQRIPGPAHVRAREEQLGPTAGKWHRPAERASRPPLHRYALLFFLFFIC
jgi:hypothetical protein